MLHILAATGNKHKVEEFRSAFQEISDKIQIITLDDIPHFEMPEENGNSFDENAMIKAKAASAFADTLAFADDSGLEVDALDKAPGIYSARYAGPGATDAQRIEKLLKAMQEKGGERTAKFVCSMALAYRGKPVNIFCGQVSGKITETPSGSHGFGYDPVFVPDGYSQSFAELGSEIKEKISHRAHALKKLVAYLKNELDSMEHFEFK